MDVTIKRMVRVLHATIADAHANNLLESEHLRIAEKGADLKVKEEGM